MQIDLLVSLVIGYVAAIIYSSFFVGNIINYLWINANIKRLKRYHIQTTILGKLEITSYFIIFALILNNQSLEINPQLILLITAWISAKTLSSVWSIKSKTKFVKIKILVSKGDAGERFNIFLIGSLLNILISFLCAYISYTINLSQYRTAGLIFLFTLVGLLSILCYIPRFPQKE